MDQYFGSLDLFEGGAETRHECMGKVADKAYGVGEQDPAAGRKLQLLENLKETRKTGWQKDFDRETAAIADEAFLSRLLQSRKQAGA